MSSTSRQYDLVLLGATGYTGKLTAEYIQEHVETNLKWAIAGRNAKKLAEVAQELKALNPDRIQPAIEVVELDKPSLDTLAVKTQVLITTIGPYWKYGTPVVEACADNGTHYLDVTGETPWVYDMLQKHHLTFQKKGKIMIPQCGVESVPADILSFLLVTHIRRTLKVGVRECVNTLQQATGTISGGTANTMATIMEAYPASHIMKSMHPYALSPISPPKGRVGEGWLTKLLGVRSIPDLGILTDSVQRGPDTAIVYRSWALFDKGEYYGQKFAFREWMRVSGYLAGIIVHYGFMAFLLSLLLPPTRWLLKKWAYQPGQGPTKEESQNNQLVYKAIAKADCEPEKRAVATFEYTGGGYYLTGILAAEAAMTILKGSETPAAKMGGGLLTSATLGEEYVERVRKAGVKIEVSMME